MALTEDLAGGCLAPDVDPHGLHVSPCLLAPNPGLLSQALANLTESLCTWGLQKGSPLQVKAGCGDRAEDGDPDFNFRMPHGSHRPFSFGASKD